MALQPHKKVLEVGVGTGLSLPLYPKNVEVYGIDISENMLARAKKGCKSIIYKTSICKSWTRSN